MFNRVRRGLKEFDSSFSIAEKLYQTLQFLIISLGGTGVLGLLAWVDPYFKRIGYLAYGLIFLLCVTLFFAMLYLYKMARLTTTKEQYYLSLTEKKVETNPLDDIFSNQVIHLEDLRLPFNDPQTKKTFRNCKLVGPMTILIGGGTITGSSFKYCGEFITLPRECESAHLGGVLQFVDCSFHECTFMQTTIIIPYAVALPIKRDMPNAEFIGLN
ncbi:hypothetical protein [Citrobacter freundii]|uniref:hypothetical protein n=2 Tax=Citrobacter freundii TaxID=546 RepID=UPI003989B552